MATAKPLARTEIERLIKILGMLGSEHAGERSAAAVAATLFLKDRKLEWKDLIGANYAEYQPIPSPSEARWRQETDFAWAPHKPPPAHHRPTTRGARPDDWKPQSQEEWQLWWTMWWRTKLDLCRAAIDTGHLNEWETGFIENLTKWRGTPTDAQLKSFSTIVARLEDIAERAKR